MSKHKCLKIGLTEKKGVYKIPKGKREYEVMDKHKCYPVRSGNKLSELKRWKKWAKKNYPKQKTIIVDDLVNMQDKLSKMRRKADLDSRYTIYGDY